MRNLALSLACLILSSTCLAQRVQHHLYTLRGDRVGDRFGAAVTGVGDLNNDRHAEFCVGAELANSQTGYIRVFSGATGRVFQTIAGAASGDLFGHAVRNAGDGQGIVGAIRRVRSALSVVSEAGCSRSPQPMPASHPATCR